MLRGKVLIMMLVLLCSFFRGSLQAESFTENIRGKVYDKTTLSAISEVEVRLVRSGLLAITNESGEFLFKDVPVGRYDISFAHLSYKAFTKPSVLVVSSRETYLELGMEASVQALEELIVLPTKERGLPNNDMALISATSFDVEDTRKFAGGLDDPVRLMSVQPGVHATGFVSENFASIRGNSPRGLKYLVEGVEIPNPTHFARIGSSGGSFTLFSLQVLDNSDFFLSAFPAEYGNATGGVFDIHFRKGNRHKHEFALQAGVLGIDLAGEGPINMNKESSSSASYLVNYRYSTLNFARVFTKSTAIPTYHDLSFKLYFPTERYGNFSFFGIAGTSNRLRPAIEDSTLWEADLDRYELLLESSMASAGLSNSFAVNDRTNWNNTIALSITDLADNKNYLNDDLELITRSVNEAMSIPLTFTSVLRHRFSNRHSNKTGLSASYASHNLRAAQLLYSTNKLEESVNIQGASLILQAFSQSMFRISDRFRATVGLNTLYHDVNEGFSLQPRLSAEYQINENNEISLGYGRHAQAEDFQIYKYSDAFDLAVESHPNQFLPFLIADHFVFGLKNKFYSNHRFRFEAYYQALNNVAIEEGGSFSVLNLNELNDLRVLVAEGEGRNYGVEAGFERFTENGLYYLLNMDVFKSEFLAGDGIWRETDYSNRYNLHFLLGKEYEIGERKEKSNLLSWNTSFIYKGGRPYTPLDLEASREEQETILNESLKNTLRDNPLFSVDLSMNYKINKEKRSSEISLQIKNLFSNYFPLYREYDTVLDKEVEIEATGFFPVMSYKVSF